MGQWDCEAMDVNGEHWCGESCFFVEQQAILATSRATRALVIKSRNLVDNPRRGSTTQGPAQSGKIGIGTMGDHGNQEEIV